MAGAAEASARPGKPVTVMTRNLYLGADINRPLNAALTAQASGKTAQQLLVALANATYVTRAIVDQTDFPVRAGLLAGEIARTRPDLVGLQEVALWRSGPLQLGQFGVPNATTVDYDFLQILLDELAARGEEYVAVSVGNRADVEAPSFTGSPFDDTIGADARDVRLTIRDVVLMHVEDGLTVTGTADQIYADNLKVSVVAATATPTRSTTRSSRGTTCRTLRRTTGSRAPSPTSGCAGRRPPRAGRPGSPSWSTTRRPTGSTTVST